MSVASYINDRLRLKIRVAIGAVFALILSGLPARCLANQEPLLELVWEAPANCPQQAEVQERIRSLVSGLEKAQWQTSLRARGVIASNGEQFELTLLIQRDLTTGKRVIASDDCRSLGKAAAVVIGLLMRREQKLGRQLSEGEMSDGVEQPARPSEPSSSAHSPNDAERSNGVASDARGSSLQRSDATAATRWHPLIIVPNLTLDLGMLPKPGLGVGLGFGLVARPWRLVASGELWLSQSKQLSFGRSSEATFQRKSAELAGCRGWSSEPFEIAPCVQLALDYVSAQATGDRITPKSEHDYLLSAGGGFAGFWHLGHRTALFLMAMGRVVARRPTFVVQGPFGSDQVHTIAPAVLATSLGCMWIF